MDITLNGHVYATSGRMNAFAQLELARKLAPAIPIIEGMINPANAEKDKTLLTVLMLSHISDENTAFIMGKCLAMVVRAQGGTSPAARIQSQPGQLMFDDITMSDLLTLTVAVIEENLGDFFRTALDNLHREKSQQD